MKFSHSKNIGTIATAASLCMGLALSSLPAFAAAGGSDRGGGDLRKLDASTIELLLQGEQLKSAMLNYLNSIKLDQVEDVQVKNTLSRITLEALRADILTRDNYKSGSQCRDSYNREVPASAKIGDQGGEICFDTGLISEQLKGQTVEEGFIRLAALTFHEHVHHFQSKWTDMKKNEDEAYRVSDYVLLTAKTVQMPSLKWMVKPDEQVAPGIDASHMSRLPQGSKIRIQLNADIAATDQMLSLGKYSYFRDGNEIQFTCYLHFLPSKKNRTLKAEFELDVDHIGGNISRYAAFEGGHMQDYCAVEESIAGKVTIDGKLRPEMEMGCTSAYQISHGTDCPNYPSPTISNLRKLIENAGGTLTPSSAVKF